MCTAVHSPRLKVSWEVTKLGVSLPLTHGPPFPAGLRAALLLVYVEDSVAARARVVRVFKVFHEEWNQAAAQHEP